MKTLSHEKSIRKGKIFIGLVGMRMSPHTRAATTLEQWEYFLSWLEQSH